MIATLPSPTGYTSCNLNSNPVGYLKLDTAYSAFQTFFGDVKTQSDTIIDNLKKELIENSSSPPPTPIKVEYNVYKENLIKTMEKIVDVIDVPYNIYSPYVNSDALKNGETVDIFSWLNCTIIGRDINATVNTIKKQLRGDLRVIFFVSLSDNCIIIAIMIVTTFLLNWYKFDPLENNPVGEMEFGKKMKEYDGENLSSDSNINSESISEKNKNESGSNEGTEDEEDDKKKNKEDEYSQKSQFGDNNGNNNNLENPQTINIKKTNDEDNKNNESKKFNKNKDDSSDSGESFRYNTIKKIAKNGDKENEINNPINNIDKNKKSINNPFN